MAVIITARSLADMFSHTPMAASLSLKATKAIFQSAKDGTELHYNTAQDVADSINKLLAEEDSPQDDLKGS